MNRAWHLLQFWVQLPSLGLAATYGSSKTWKRKPSRAARPQTWRCRVFLAASPPGVLHPERTSLASEQRSDCPASSPAPHHFLCRAPAPLPLHELAASPLLRARRPRLRSKPGCSPALPHASGFPFPCVNGPSQQLPSKRVRVSRRELSSAHGRVGALCSNRANPIFCQGQVCEQVTRPKKLHQPPQPLYLHVDDPAARDKGEVV